MTGRPLPIRLRRLGLASACLFAMTACSGETLTAEIEVEEPSDAEVQELLEDAAAGASSEAKASIEVWLIEVGNDFPDAAKCVAGEMSEYSVDDFEKSFAGEVNEPFESELDAAYEKCDAALGITSEE